MIPTLRGGGFYLGQVAVQLLRWDSREGNWRTTCGQGPPHINFPRHAQAHGKPLYPACRVEPTNDRLPNPGLSSIRTQGETAEVNADVEIRHVKPNGSRFRDSALLLI